MRKVVSYLRKTFFLLLILANGLFGLTADMVESYTIEVKTKGRGEVTLSPAGGVYRAGTEVTITAGGERGFTFFSWDGDLEGYKSSVKVVVEDDLEITALFKRGYRKSLVQNTNYGRVKGQRESYSDSQNSNIDFDILSWRGLPFAAPPVGELRWKAPREPESWNGIREARLNGQPAAQSNMFEGKLMGGEDCLYLNIFRPNSSEEGLPVYFWLHGGGNVSGYAGEYEQIRSFADRNNAVVVVTQYRLSDMGVFLSEELEGTELDRSGNYITLDQIKALEWVRDNIEYFGGNPGNVTVAGESAGALGVLGLMVSPLAKGLFQRAVYQSGGMAILTRAEALAQSNGLALALRQKRAAEGITVDESGDLLELLREAQALELITIANAPRLHGLIIDGTVIPEDPLKMVAAGNYNRVPIILGGCKDEINIIQATFMPYVNLMLNRQLGTQIADYRSLVPLLKKGIDVHKGYKGPDGELKAISPQDIDSFIKSCSLLSKLMLVKNVHNVAELLRQHQDDVYLFQYNWDGENGSQFQKIIGAGHGAEIPFFHGGSSIDFWKWGNVYTDSTKAGREELERVMCGYMGAFIRSGDPNSADLPLWEPLDGAGSVLRQIILDSRESNNTAETAYEMVETRVDRSLLIQEGMAFEGKDRGAFDMFRIYLMNLRL